MDRCSKRSPLPPVATRLRAARRQCSASRVGAAEIVRLPILGSRGVLALKIEPSGRSDCRPAAYRSSLISVSNPAWRKWRSPVAASDILRSRITTNEIQSVRPHSLSPRLS